MPMRNSQAHIGASIRSVIGQSSGDWELIVVDDGSADSSYEEVDRHAANDPRIRLFTNPGPQGVAHARNYATLKARGRYIAFLDSDDLWLPTKLEKQLQLCSATGTALTYTGYYKVSGNCTVEAEAFTPNNRSVVPPAALDYRQMLRQDYIGFLTAMYDSQILGKRYFPDLERRQDYAMLLKIFREGVTARGITEPLAIYRAARSGSLSSNKLTTSRFNWHIYRHVEKLPLHQALWAFGNYAVRSGLKYLI